jgi:L-2-hydroxyglutarate oxidase
MSGTCYDVAIIGGGIVGAATAMALTNRFRASVVVLEAENRLAAHQTGNNSGVIHSGLYYKPGSLKATTCVEGSRALFRFCETHGILHERCGKIVVATEAHEIPALEELERRGIANGLAGVTLLTPEQIREREPNATGIRGLYVPDTGIVDFTTVTDAYAGVARGAGAEFVTGAKVLSCVRKNDGITLETHAGEFMCRNLINAAGLQCDRVARMCGASPDVKIVPFRGEYYKLKPERQDLVKNLIYPVPDPRFPFLGVHFTRMIHGGIEAGPNAVLALKREGYTKLSLSPLDAFETLTYPGFWRLASKYWKTGVAEMYRSLSKAAFARALARLVPGITSDDLIFEGIGVRAQAVDAAGNLIDDFRIVETERMIHVLNAPSPAATASMSIGESIAAMAETSFNLERKT